MAQNIKKSPAVKRNQNISERKMVKNEKLLKVLPSNK